jgi:hypothetical protein
MVFITEINFLIACAKYNIPGSKMHREQIPFTFLLDFYHKKSTYQQYIKDEMLSPAISW